MPEPREQRPAASLRARLIAWLLGAVAIVGVAVAALAYVDARHEIDELLDAHLTQAAALILAQTGHESDERELEHAPEMHRYGRRVAFQLWDGGTSLRLHSTQAPDRRLSAKDEGFSDVDIEGRPWRVFSGWDREHRLLVQVGEQRRVRNEIAAAIARSVVVPFAIGLPLVGALVWFGVGLGLAPLRAIAREVGARAPSHLAPISLSAVPAEVVPLIAALDRLFARVRASIDSERRFTADAAHELRTPIAAVRAQAQVARQAGADATRAHALDGVMAGCDRAARLIDQLLTLARLEPGEAARGGAVALRAIARDVIGDAAPAALASGVDIELEPGAEVTVDGDPDLLAILLRNLVDNAVRYGMGGTVVRVSAVSEHDGGVVLAVVDAGPGVPRAERARLGERFYRGGGQSAVGSGLGLSIVCRIAELHHAEVDFGEGPGGRGLAVTVRFAPR